MSRLHGHFQHGGIHPVFPDGKLGGVNTYCQTAGAGIEVVAAERPLSAWIELALGIEGQRMRRNHRTLAQNLRYVFRQQAGQISSGHREPRSG